MVCGRRSGSAPGARAFFENRVRLADRSMRAARRRRKPVRGLRNAGRFSIESRPAIWDQKHRETPVNAENDFGTVFWNSPDSLRFYSRKTLIFKGPHSSMERTAVS